MIQYSKSRGRFVIEIHLEADGLKDNMKFWSIKNFLIPYTELIKMVIQDHNPRLLSNEMEKVINFGYSKIEINCLSAFLEGDCNESLFSTNIGLENLTNYHLLLAANTEEEIIKCLDCFQNKKVIPQYDDILWQIIKNKATFKTEFATPAGHYMEASFTKSRSEKIKKILNSKLDSSSREENVLGILTGINLKAKANHRFSLLSSIDQCPYQGIIDSALDKSIPELVLNFRGKEYNCRLQVTHTPASKLQDENYEYILMDISEV